MIVSKISTPPRVPAVWLTSSWTSANWRLVRYSDRTGTKAVENAPSANKRLKKLGILKATKKASAPPPAPKYWATTTSRTIPSTRDNKVKKLTMLVERINP